MIYCWYILCHVLCLCISWCGLFSGLTAPIYWIWSLPRRRFSDVSLVLILDCFIKMFLMSEFWFSWIIELVLSWLQTFITSAKCIVECVSIVLSSVSKSNRSWMSRMYFLRWILLKFAIYLTVSLPYTLFLNLDYFKSETPYRCFVIYG